MTLGDVIKNYRTQNNISMDEFARQSSLSKGYISMLENNINPRNNKPIAPTLPSIAKIAKGMNTDLDSLLKQIDQKQIIELNDYGSDLTNGHVTQSTHLTPNKTVLLKEFDKLNNTGQEKAIERVEELTYIEKYRRSDLADTETTATLEYPTNLVDYDTLKETHAYKYETMLQGTTAGGYPLLALQEHEPRSVKTNIKCDYALLLKGNSMEPDYPNGCILLINRFFDFIDGDVCIVEIDVAAEMAETTCKKVYIKDNQVELVPINKAHDTQTYSVNEVKIIGKVVGMMN